MGGSPLGAMIRHNLKLLLGDPGPIILFIAIPILSMAVMKPTQEAILRGEGFADANGSEQVVPGFIVMFLFLWTITLGRAFFVEHGWGTWERLRATSASTSTIIIGKVLPGFLLVAAQIVISMIFGVLVFGLESAGPILALLIVMVPLCTCVLAMTIALVAITGTYAQLEAAGNLFMIVFASVGGALTPVSILPGWAQDIAPAFPSYWPLEAARDVLLRGEGVEAVLGPAAVLTLFTLFFAAVGLARFSATQSKAIEI